MHNKKLYKLNVTDVVAALLVMCVSIMPLLSFGKTNLKTAKTADVYMSGKLVAKLSLGRDIVYKIKNMEIEVSKGRVRVEKSDCPRQICVHQGWISAPSQTLVCVPNKMLVEIEGSGGSGGYDAVTY
jgi:hypothetical protein